MEIHIENRDCTNFKLTVAKDRISIKVPNSSVEPERMKIIDFLTCCAHDIGATETTMRGAFNKKSGNIHMTVGNAKTHVKSYYTTESILRAQELVNYIINNG